MDEDVPFDLGAFLPYTLNQAAEATSRGFAGLYKARYGMLRTEWRVLFHLGRYGDMTASQICDRASLHKTKVSRAVRALELKRFLARTTQQNDRRHATLALTRLGARVYADLAAAAREYDNDLAAEFTVQERAVLDMCLRKLAKL
ncbi:MarR family winged helix-turn-helix transcriptional regulator [Sulfitobacter sp. S190]|uniref:MarR family winged helix-turn-helix transcriptional regulator n=1 Tax=Sulfitobacter sp. S190 TaxID=2867022 RepID=UPI0021A4FBEB|nr:MarR family transcriptional regulator [Sulfitobacter sp. S190]UWR23037.1 MarR family transcriptional regulator [Sulfitobacter sp. S190]